MRLAPSLVPPGAALALLLGAALPGALLSGCAADDRVDAGTDAAPTVPIAQLQGRGDRSPFEGGEVVVEAVVGGVFGGLGGVSLQSLAPDDDPATSEGLFLLHPKDATPQLRVGDVVRVHGVVREIEEGGSALTALEPRTVAVDGRAEVPATVLTAPPAAGWEALEGMLVHIDAPLTVTGNDGLWRHGELALAFGGRLYTPTELAPPGPAAETVAADNARRLLRIDDARRQADPETIWYLPATPDDTAPLRVGSTVGDLHGVVDHRFGSHRLQLTDALTVLAQAPRPAPPTVAGDRRIAGFNLLNLFNGDGSGGGFPTSRGADSRSGYLRQQAKLVAVVQALDPDLAALMEVENDGFAADSSLAQFVDALNVAGPHDDWRYIDAGSGPGVDSIRVGLIYRETRLAPVGQPATIVDGPFAERSRAPLAQAFRADGGPVFVVVANHFKSKGCRDEARGDDADHGDGQGCFNGVRLQSAQRLHEWLAGDPTGTDPAGTLVIGDLNTYAQEDPLRWLREQGWRDAFAGPLAAGGPPPYSYVFSGQAGRLDHALLDAGLAPRLRGAAEWHNNADESERFDYRLDADADPWRASDHDPLLLGLDLASPAL